MKNRWANYAISIIGVFAILRVLSCAFSPWLFPHTTELQTLRDDVSRIKRASSRNVGTITILLGGGQGLTLRRPKDGQSIDLMFNSLQRITVSDRGSDSQNGDIIVVGVNPPDAHEIRIHGHFDPDNAPVVSDRLRSDDLGKVVYAVFRSKGIVPRKGNLSR